MFTEVVEKLNNNAVQRFSRRRGLSVIMSLLENSYFGTRKTHLMFKCNLNVSQFKKYSDLLIGAGLLKKTVETSSRKSPIETYFLTEKGMEFLRGNKGISRVLD